MATSKKKPNLVVSGQSAAKGHWTQIGVGWTNTRPDGTKYIHVVLDFWPNTNELTIWPMDEKDKLADPTPASEDEKGG